jgi:hypothetical protein
MAKRCRCMKCQQIDSVRSGIDWLGPTDPVDAVCSASENEGAIKDVLNNLKHLPLLPSIIDNINAACAELADKDAKIERLRGALEQLGSVLRKTDPQTAPSPVEETCEWTQSNLWWTSGCGITHNDGILELRNICPNCGKTIVVKVNP